MIRNRILWIVWIAGIALLHLFGNNFGTRVILTASLAVSVISVMIPLLIKRGVKIQFTLNDNLSGTIKVNRKCILNCTVECINSLTNEIVRNKLSVSSIMEFGINSEHCGQLRIILSDVYISDMFKLFKYKINFHEEKRVLIFPRTFNTEIILTDDITPIIDNDIYSTTKAGNDPSETFAVREYIQGDSIKSIHWKLSQKSPELMVKEYGLPVVNHVLVLFESLYKTIPLNYINAMSNVFMSVSLGLLDEDIVHTIGWKQNDTELFIGYEVKTKDDLNICMEEFLSNTVTVSDTTVIAGYKNSGDYFPYNHIIVVASYIEPDIESIYNGNRITVLQCDNADYINPGNINVIDFPVDKYQSVLNKLEL